MVGGHYGGNLIDLASQRLDFLERLGEVALEKREMVDELDHSRSTVNRAVAELEDAARERGVTHLYARTARRQEAAVAFYPANGYEQVDTETYGEYDLVIYEKYLD
jgi:DNA-binding transcriptional MocR family regulator